MINLSASFHVIAHCDYFTFYVNGDYGHVRIGNEEASKIVGISDICLETNIGCKLLLKNVRHISDIHLNLISTASLMMMVILTKLVKENGSSPKAP